MDHDAIHPNGACSISAIFQSKIPVQVGPPDRMFA
jgi:hypothetical protein